MRRIYANLHIHSKYSTDGNNEREDLVKHAKYINLKAVAFPEHDTLHGIEELRELARKYGMIIPTAVEITIADYSSMSFYDAHVLGYGFDERNRRLIKVIKKNRRADVESKRHELIVKKIAQDLVTREFGKSETDIETRIKEAVEGELSRPKILAAVHRLFLEYEEQVDVKIEMGPGGKLYVPKENYAGLGDAISAIRDAGGIAFLAHPERYIHPNLLDLKKDEKGIKEDITRLREELIKPMMILTLRLGAEGPEVRYPYNRISFHKKENLKKIVEEDYDKIIEYYLRFCADVSINRSRSNLLYSGGTDSHILERDPINECGLTEEEFEAFRSRLKLAA